jgi:hypothetical protein
MGGVLHPGPRNMADHPPLHALVPGGALAPDGAPGLSPRSPDGLVPSTPLRTLPGHGHGGADPRGSPRAGAAWSGHRGDDPGLPAGTGTAVLASCAPSCASDGHHPPPPGNARRRARHLPRHGRPGHAWTHRTRPAKRVCAASCRPGCPRGAPQSAPLGSSAHPVAERWRRAARAWPPAPAMTRPRQAAPTGTRMRRFPPQRWSATAGPAVGHSSACAGGCLTQAGRPQDGERGPETPAGVPWSRAARPGVRHRASPACEAFAGLRPTPQSRPASLTATQGPMGLGRRSRCRAVPSCFPAALGVHGASLLLSSPSPTVHSHRARLPTTGLFNPALWGGVAPHDAYSFGLLRAPFIG